MFQILFQFNSSLIVIKLKTALRSGKSMRNGASSCEESESSAVGTWSLKCGQCKHANSADQWPPFISVWQTRNSFEWDRSQGDSFRSLFALSQCTQRILSNFSKKFKFGQWRHLMNGFWGALVQIQLTPLILIESNEWTHHSIALKVFYLSSFELDSMWRSVRPQNPFKRGCPARWRALPVTLRRICAPTLRPIETDLKEKL